MIPSSITLPAITPVVAITGAPSPGPTPGPTDFVYLPHRGSFELHAKVGHGYYVWDDGSFNDDNLAFLKLVVLPTGVANLIGQVYQADGASFFIFFGGTAFGTTPDGLNEYAMYFSVDQINFFPWPTSQGALRFPIQPAHFPPIANVLGSGPVAQQIGNRGSTSTFERQGLAWKLTLSEADVQALSQSATFASDFIPDPEVLLAVTFAIGFIESVDSLGGNNGVDISGILGTPTIIVTPHGVFNIMQAIQIVNGVATFIGDQSSSLVTSTANTISQGFQKASQAVGNSTNQAIQWFSNPHL